MTPLPRDPTGHHPFVDWCRKMSRAVTERTLLAGPGIRVTYEQNGTRIHSLAGPGAGPKLDIRRLFIVAVQNDYLECSLDDSTAATFNVAKPWKLQRTPWHGSTVNVLGANVTYSYVNTQTRNATRDAVVEVQVIVPAYLAARDWIYAVQAETDAEDQDGSPLTWIDLNTDARAWAKRA